MMHPRHMSALQHPPILKCSLPWHARQMFSVSYMSISSSLTKSRADLPVGLVSWLYVPPPLEDASGLVGLSRGRLAPEDIVPIACCSLLTSLRDLYGGWSGGDCTTGGIIGAPPMLLTMGLCAGRGGGDRTGSGILGTGRGGKDSEAIKAAVSHCVYCRLTLSTCCWLSAKCC